MGQGRELEPLAELVAVYILEEANGDLVWAKQFRDAGDDQEKIDKGNELLGKDSVRVCTLLYAIYSAVKDSFQCGLSKIQLEDLNILFVLSNDGSRVACGSFIGSVPLATSKCILENCLGQATINSLKAGQLHNDTKIRNQSSELLWQAAAFGNIKRPIMADGSRSVHSHPSAWAFVSRVALFDVPISVSSRSNWIEALLAFVRRRSSSVQPVKHKSLFLSSPTQDKKSMISNMNKLAEDPKNVELTYRNMTVLVPTIGGSQTEAFAWVARNSWIFPLLTK